IGSSLAGATTAWILGSSGLQVALIDPITFPRQKACGEGLSHMGLSFLQSLALWSPELEKAATPFWGYRVYPQAGRAFNLCSLDTPQGVGISRVLLDGKINEKVASLTTVTPIASSVTHATFNQSPYQHWDISLSDESTISAKSLVVASGGAELMKIFPKTHAPKYKKAKDSRYGMALWATGEWQTENQSMVHIHHRNEGQYLVTPLTSESVNISMLLSGKIHIKKAEALETACTLATKSGFHIHEISPALGAASISHRTLTSTPKELYFIGDAVERFDPIGGMGMTHALYSAGLAANKILLSHSANYNFTNHSSTNHYSGLKSNRPLKRHINTSAPDSNSYYKNRARISFYLRLLSYMSVVLNVKENRALISLARHLPKICLRTTDYIKNCLHWETTKMLALSIRPEPVGSEPAGSEPAGSEPVRPAPTSRPALGSTLPSHLTHTIENKHILASHVFSNDFSEDSHA
ncbi:MAG: hypothetical protein KDD60_10785, partial [Bdellovibrionales bacterium]|nr:hypothetical protein [Bdellovibrionales bacterium]